MKPLLAILQHTALSAFSKTGSETSDFVSTDEANGIGAVKYFGFVILLYCQIYQEVYMIHKPHYYFGHNYCIHRFEWALHLSNTVSDCLN